MQANDWATWCNDVVLRLTNVEKTLKAYHKTQKRMLYMIAIGFVTVLGNGLLLFYK